MKTTEELTSAIYQLIATSATSATGGVHNLEAGEHVAGPYVVFSVINDTPTQTHSGECGGVRRVQVDCYATSPELCAKIRDEINDVLSGYIGDNQPIGTILRLWSHSDFERDTLLYRQSTDYRISY